MICTHQRGYLFGDVIDGDMLVNRCGEVVQSEWDQTSIVRPYVELDAFVVMPNHVHGIIVIVDGDTDNDKRDMMGGRVMVHHVPTKREFSKPIAHSLSTIVGAF